MKELYKVLKDHKNQHMQDLVLSSYQHCYKQEARKKPGKLSGMIATLSIHKLLQIDKFGFTASSITAQPPSPMVQKDEKRFPDKLTILVNDISIAMEKLNYAMYRGKCTKRKAGQSTRSHTDVRPVCS